MYIVAERIESSNTFRVVEVHANPLAGRRAFTARTAHIPAHDAAGRPAPQDVSGYAHGSVGRFESKDGTFVVGSVVRMGR